MKTVLVIGAQGVLGGLAAEVLRANGWRVLRAGRRPEDATDFRWVDLAQPQSIASACSGVDMVINAVEDGACRAERHVLQQGGLLLNMATIKAADRDRLLASVPQAKGSVIFGVGYSGLTGIAIKDLLAQHPEADHVDAAYTLSIRGMSGGAGALFGHRLLTGGSRRPSREFDFAAPFGQLTCLEVDARHERWVDPVSLGQRSSRFYLSLAETGVFRLCRWLDRVGLLARLPAAWIKPRPPQSRRIEDASTEPMMTWLGVSQNGQPLASCVLSAKGDYLTTARIAELMARLVLAGERRHSGLFNVDTWFDWTEIAPQLSTLGIALCGHNPQLTETPMSTAINPQASYVRHISTSGGRFSQWKLNLILRLAVKRTYRYGFDVADYRQRQAKLDPKLSPIDPCTRRSRVNCDGVSADWVEVPESRSDKVVLYIHGGAWFSSYPNLHHNLVARLCRQIGAKALVVDYRLAPEHRFPAGIDDCWTTWRWLLAQGVAAKDIVIAGDSAGGNLSLALLHRIKAAGDDMPACAVLLSPMVDFTLSSPSLVTNEKRDSMFTGARMIGLRHLYIDAEQMLHPDASPLFANFHGLPPLLFQSSESEVLRDDSLRAAAKAHASGVKVEVELWAGMPHVFQSMVMLPQSQAALLNMADFIRRHSSWH